MRPAIGRSFTWEAPAGSEYFALAGPFFAAHKAVGAVIPGAADPARRARHGGLETGVAQQLMAAATLVYANLVTYKLVAPENLAGFVLFFFRFRCFVCLVTFRRYRASFHFFVFFWAQTIYVALSVRK